MDSPLVSVFIITYNSAEFILDALDSVKNQTYSNIELIISDDHSSDPTVEICKKWLQINSSYFKNTKLVTTPFNTGVAANCNRAVKSSSGKWLKVLAGDDTLPPDSIEEYVKYVSTHPECQIVFAKLNFIGENKELNEKIEQLYLPLYHEIKAQDHQFRRYLKKHFIPGTGLFFTRHLYDKIGGYDERFPMCEEYPFNLKFLKIYNLYFLDKFLYNYRVREESLSNCEIPNYRHYKDRWKFTKKLKMKEQLKNGLIFNIYEDYLQHKLLDYTYFHKNLSKQKLFNFLLRFNPLRLINKFSSSSDYSQDS